MYYNIEYNFEDEEHLSFKEKIDLYVSRIDKLRDDKGVDHEEEIRMYRDMIWDKLCMAQGDEERQYANKYLNYRELE